MNPIPKSLFEIALDRAITLRLALNTLSTLQPPNEIANRLIKATLEALYNLSTKCQQLKSDCDKVTPSNTFRYIELEKEGRLYNTFLEFLETQLYPLLQRAFSTDTPSEVVLPIRQLTSRLFPDSDVLMISTPEMKYKFGQIGPLLRENFDILGYADILDSNKIPRSLWLLQVCAMPPSGILTHTLISHELGHGIYQTRNLSQLIMPHIGGNSLDVRLGSYFITHRRANVSNIDPNGNMLAERRAEIEEETFVPIGDYFVLHPRQFAIGGTLEYIGMPEDLSAYVTGKSSWGRLGLVIATATGIHAWFRGIITLELANVGEVPLLLYPGRSIAQLFFHSTTPQLFNEADQSSYFGAVKPEGIHLKPDTHLREVGRKLGYTLKNISQNSNT
ncbi:MAG: dCTP deaminase [Dehalococcoidia bacterium]|nr:dCTP deaminase [Dehalococcoidia bacterium]